MSASDQAAGHWRGPTRRYDLIKELVVALLVVTLLTVVLAAVFSSPDEQGVTLQRWARAAPGDFVATAASELDGSSGTAGYGAPYNHNGPGQAIGPLHLQRWIGVHIPVDPAGDFVLSPLHTVSGNATVATALATYDAATDAQRRPGPRTTPRRSATCPTATRPRWPRATTAPCRP